MSAPIDLILRLVVIIICSLTLVRVMKMPSGLGKTKKGIEYRFDQELSSYIDMIARVNALLIQFEEIEDATEAYHRIQEFRTKIDQQYMSWYRQNGLFERKGISLEKLHYGDKIEKAFEHCDQWNWSERKGEHIGEH
tara:strand:- start:139 stop:549 length:411 start_codon:yes stop_codon:yes gene_type:complete